MRTYAKTPIETQQAHLLNELFAAHTGGPFQTALRFKLITARPGDSTALKGLGTYGMIKHPAGFIIGAMDQAAHNLEDFGYVMEQIILFATDLNLGSCWLGGSFQQSNFAQTIGAANGRETVPAVISLGNPAPKRSLRESFARFVVKPHIRLPWKNLFFSGNFNTPLTQADADEYADPLEMVRIAPSAANCHVSF